MHSDKFKQYNGRLSQGDAAVSHPVIVRLKRDGIEIDAGLNMPQGDVVRIWKYGGLTSAVPVTQKSQDVLVHSVDHPDITLYVADSGFAASLAELTPQIGARSWRLQALKPGAIITACILTIGGGIWATGFSPSKAIAGAIPESTRNLLGRNVVSSFSKERKVCQEESGRDALNRMMKRLSSAAGREQPFKVTVIDWNLVNAFAAPGGRLMLTRGLINKATSADMVAGVMAHEIGHGLELHPEAGLVRALGMSAAAEFFFTGSSNSIKNIGLVLATLSYTRAAESEADQHALRILRKAKISAVPLAEFFEKLGGKKRKKAKKRKSSRFGKIMKRLSFLRTHPPSPERAAMIKAQSDYTATPVLSATDWQALRDICGKRPKRKSPAFYRNKRIESARAAIKVASAKIELNPKDIKAYRARASAYRTIKKYNKALDDLSRVIDLDPGKGNNYFNRASVYNKMKKRQLAITDLSTAIQLEPKNRAFLLRRARAYKALKKWDMAIGDYTTTINLAPKSSSFRASRGRVHIRAKNWDAAIADYSAAIKLRPKFARYYTRRATAKRGKKLFEAALGDINTALKLQPKSGYNYMQRGITMLAMNLDEDAIADLSKAVSLSPTYTQAFTQRGYAYERVGDSKAAIADYRKAAKLRAYSKSAKRAQAKARERLDALGGWESPIPY